MDLFESSIKNLVKVSEECNGSSNNDDLMLLVWFLCSKGRLHYKCNIEMGGLPSTLVRVKIK